MDYKQIKQLIKLVEDSGISAFSIEEDNVKIEIKKELAAQNISVPLPAAAMPAPVQLPVPAAPAQAELPTAEEPKKDDPNLKTITSPMVGTFYSSANPESPAYVKKGDKISQGDILCIVEAMKLFNEIEAEISGTIEEICVQDKEAVEYGQALFVVRVG